MSVRAGFHRNTKNTISALHSSIVPSTQQTTTRERNGNFSPSKTYSKDYSANSYFIHSFLHSFVPSLQKYFHLLSYSLMTQRTRSPFLSLDQSS
mmetsp:Transcript_2513/g.5495  ORF Transcript_2513/g.5495 Transcript_2513/m.5495 type:complete len:94 (+) Transcript_2513:99-380(+)